jgi:hypothetical protein
MRHPPWRGLVRLECLVPDPPPVLSLTPLHEPRKVLRTQNTVSPSTLLTAPQHGSRLPSNFSTKEPRPYRHNSAASEWRAPGWGGMHVRRRPIRVRGPRNRANLPRRHELDQVVTRQSEARQGATRYATSAAPAGWTYRSRYRWEAAGFWHRYRWPLAADQPLG